VRLRHVRYQAARRRTRSRSGSVSIQSAAREISERKEKCMSDIVKFCRTARVEIWGQSGANNPSRVLQKGLSSVKIDCKCLACCASVACEDGTLPLS
jgi:hypothetical protein